MRCPSGASYGEEILALAKAWREDPTQFHKEFPYALQSWKSRIRLSLVLFTTQ